MFTICSILRTPLNWHRLIDNIFNKIVVLSAAFNVQRNRLDNDVFSCFDKYFLNLLKCLLNGSIYQPSENWTRVYIYIYYYKEVVCRNSHILCKTKIMAKISEQHAFFRSVLSFFFFYFCISTLDNWFIVAIGKKSTIIYHQAILDLSLLTLDQFNSQHKLRYQCVLSRL